MTIAADHAIRTQVRTLLDLASRPEFSNPAVASEPTFAQARDRIFGAARSIHELVERTSGDLVSLFGLAQMAGTLQAPIDQVNAFVNNKNAQHLINAANQIDQNVQPFVWAFTPISVAPSLPADILEEHRRLAAETFRALGENGTQLQARAEALGAQVSQFAAKLDALTEKVAADRAVASAEVAKLQQAFAENETERIASFAKVVETLTEDFKSFLKESGGKAAELVTNLERKRDEAARIVQVVGNIGVTGNYQRIANAESTQANFWRWVTVAVFALGLGVAGATFYKFWGQPFSSENALAVAVRLLYAIAITAPAWYTAKESARHRTNTDRARQTELELASIGPFIELMPDDKKSEIREQLAKAYFGRPIEAHAVSSPFDLGGVKDLVVEAIKASKK